MCCVELCRIRKSRREKQLTPFGLRRYLAVRLHLFICLMASCALRTLASSAVFTITQRGMYVYDPDSKKISTVKDGPDWLESAKWNYDRPVVSKKK